MKSNGIKRNIRKTLNVSKFLDENQVPKDKQKVLLEKIENNETWDCYKEEEASKVPQDFYTFSTETGLDYIKYYRFEDGSFIKVGLEKPNNTDESKNDKKTSVGGDVVANGSSSTAYGTSYWDIKIYKEVGLLKAWFYADFYQARVGCGPSNITNIYAPNIVGFGADALPSAEIVRGTEDVSLGRYAIARSYWFVKSEVSGSWGWFTASIPVGSSCELWLGVGKGQVCIDSRLPY